MTDLRGHNTASIPQGAQFLVGAPATAVPVERLEALRQAMSTVPEVAEAHLALVFAKELGKTPQLFLAVLPQEGASPSDLPPRIASALGADSWAAQLPVILVTDPTLAQTLHAAGVRVFPDLSPDWAKRGRNDAGASKRILVAVIISLLVLAAWELLNP